MWEKWLARLAPADTAESVEREHIASVALVDRLKPFGNLSWIDQYASRYGILPQEAEKVRFDNFMPFIYLWKEQQEYQERYQIAAKSLKGDS
jgi:hypothetical protein